MVTILIPTANRPVLLAEALRSVSAQTAASQIREIIVSENAGDIRSQEVCRQFSDLPIKYIFREPQMPPIEHGATLFKAQWSGEYIAVLHDDDWWTPDFLSKGIEALNSHPNASIFCCNSYDVREEDIVRFFLQSLCFWFGANYPKFEPLWELSSLEVLLACVLQTPAHYSTIMARAEAVRSYASVFETGNRFDNDRMFIFELSRQGTLLYSPLPQAFTRIHTGQDTNSFTYNSKITQMCRTTEWMVERSGESWESLGGLFYGRAERCPRHIRGDVHDAALEPWVLPTLIKHVDKSSNVARFYRRIHTRARLKSLVKKHIPPLLFEKGRSIYRTFKRRPDEAM